MATTTTQPVRLHAASSANPVVLWHLLSLDAPSVAALWTWFVARSRGIHLPWTTITSMFLAVWALYAADRLLDARTLQQRLDGLPGKLAPVLEARHVFHHRHRARFLPVMAAAAFSLCALIPRLSPVALKLFSAEGLLLTLWFTTLHATRLAPHLPKELALGPFFAAAVYIPTLARTPNSVFPLLPGAVLFALLCSLNCLFIHTWESPSGASAHPSTQFAARYSVPLAATLILAAALLAFALRPLPAAESLACALAAATLLLLHYSRASFARTTLRAAADAALLTPLLLLPLTR